MKLLLYNTLIVIEGWISDEQHGKVHVTKYKENYLL